MANNYNLHTTSKKNKTSKNFRKGLIFVSVFSALFLLVAFNLLPFLNSIVLGALGLFFYAICLGFVAYGVLTMFEKEIFLEKLEILFMFIWLAVFVALLHLVSTNSFIDQSFGQYLAQVFIVKNSVGGVLFSILVYPIFKITHIVATYSMLTILLIILTAVILDKLHANKQFKKLNFSLGTTSAKTLPQAVDQPDTTQLNVNNEIEEESVIIPDELVEEPSPTLSKYEEEKSKAKRILGLSKEDKETNKNILDKGKGRVITVNDSETQYNVLGINAIKSSINDNAMQSEESGVRPPRFVHAETGIKQKPAEQTHKQKRELSETDKRNLAFIRATLGGDLKKINESQEKQETEISPPPRREEAYETINPYDYDNQRDIYDKKLNKRNYKEKVNTYSNNNNENVVQKRSFEEDYFSYDNNSNTEKAEDKTKNDAPYYNQKHDLNEDTFKQVNTFSKPEFVRPAFEKKKAVKAARAYNKPPLELLQTYEPNEPESEEDYTLKAEQIEQILSSFKVPATVVSVIKGPTFTRFEMQMPVGIPVKRIANYSDDIAMALESHGSVRIETPIPGKNAFGVEVPNKVADIVGMRDVLESYAFQGNKSLLTFALGKDITGESKTARLDKMPHVLVAGATNSGKSVCLNAIIISLIYKASPDDVRIIIIDPKRVEFTLYNGLPHLLVPEVICEPDKAISALSWVIDEMQRRFTIFSKYAVRNLGEYLALDEVKNGLIEKFPYIVVIVDELADLMIINKKEVEDKIIRIAQLSRAAGIHLVLATQRPSVNVITGVIKANLPSRIAFRVTSNVDSRTILDAGGANDLLGNGDMLYSPSDTSDLIRLQGAYISNNEIAAVVDYVKENNEPDFDSDIEDAMFNKKQNVYDASGQGDGEYDPLLKDSIRNFIKSQSASISRLQRLHSIGFPRAGKIVDQLESLGYISEKDSNNNRKIFMTQQEFEETFGEDL